MAAKMKILRSRQVFSVVFMLMLCDMINIVHCSTTAPPGSTGPATTDAPTSPATSSPTPANTTQVQTSSIPTATPSPVPANTELAYCTCDVTGNACDVNCCCDGDCDGDDRLAFGECLPFSVSTNDKLCMRSEIILFENSPLVSNFTSDNLFCLYFDNNAERNFYNIPDLVTTEEAFNGYIRDYADFSFQSEPVVPPTYSDFYKSNDKIYVIYETQTQGVLALPTSLASTYCTDGNPTAYLIDANSECVRSINNLVTECSSLPALSSSSYNEGFRVVTSPVLFQKYIPTNDTNSTTAALGDITDLYNNTYTIPVTMGTVRCKDLETGLTDVCNVTVPTYNTTAGTCNNAVLQVAYNIIHDGTNGIVNITVDFLLGSIRNTTGTQLLSQTYFTTFNGASETDTFRRSGNPGYVLGAPVMAGILNNTVDADGVVTQEIILNTNRDQWLTMKSSSDTSDCTGNSRLSVVFGEDVRSGCFLQISLTGVIDYCELLQQRIVNILEGDLAPIFNTATNQYSTLNRHVATFGNSDVTKVGDWLPLQVQGRPKPGPAVGLRCSLSLGMTIQILYAKVGSLSNAQSKILGASFVYDQPEDVYYRCVGPYCQPGIDLSQKLEITTSAEFIDVSQPAVGFEAEPPLFLAKVPYDFFYPFLTGTSPSARPTINCLLLVFMFITTWFRL